MALDLIDRARVPAEVAATFDVRTWRPRTRLGFSIFRSLRYLPDELAAELLDRIQSIAVIESSLALAVIRPYRGRMLVEDLGIVSRKVVTNAGVNYIAADVAGGVNDSSAFKFHGIGTGVVAEATSDTALGTELTTAYNPDSTRATGSQSSATNVYTTVGTNAVDAAVAITEHGIFTQAATGGGTLLDRSVFAAVNLSSGDSLQSTYAFTITAGG